MVKLTLLCGLILVFICIATVAATDFAAYSPCAYGGCGTGGCCDYNTLACKCDANKYGPYCSSTSPAANSYSHTFKTMNKYDDFTYGQVVYNSPNLKMTVVAPSSMSAWTSRTVRGYGTFTFNVKSTGVSGSGMVLKAQATAGRYRGFAITLGGNATRLIAVETFGSATSLPLTWYPLTFDSSIAYHSYKVKYTAASIVVSADTTVIVTILTPSLGDLLSMSAETRFNSITYGNASAPSAIGNIQAVSWTAAVPPPTCNPRPPYFKDMTTRDSDDALQFAIMGPTNLTLPITLEQAYSRWGRSITFGTGNYSFTVEQAGISGTGLKMSSQSYSTIAPYGFEVKLYGNQTNIVGFSSINNGVYKTIKYNLPFSSAGASHTYTVNYGAVFKLYVDGQLIATSTANPAASQHRELDMSVSFDTDQANYGLLDSSSLPAYSYVNAVSWNK